MIDIVNKAIRLVENAAMRVDSPSDRAGLMSEARKLREAMTLDKMTEASGGISLSEQIERLTSALTPKERELLAGRRQQLDEELRNRRLDVDRLNWLNDDDERVEDVRGRMINEGVSAREAIDWLRDMRGGEAKGTAIPPSKSQTGQDRDRIGAEVALRKAIRDLPGAVGEIEREHLFNLLDKIVMP